MVGKVFIRVLRNGWLVVDNGILGFPIELIPRIPLANKTPVSDVAGSYFKYLISFKYFY